MKLSRTGPLPSTARLSKTLPLKSCFVTLSKIRRSSRRVPQPQTGNATGLYHQFSLGSIPFRSPLLRESLLLSIPRVTQMFQFTRFPLPALYIQTGVTPHNECRVTPFGHPRINAWSTAPRGLSQPPTSFIGSRRQGIHRWLLVAWKSDKHIHLAQMLVLAMQFSRNNRNPKGTDTTQR